ncbi:zinc finger protein 704-like [Microcaecilia unicolor]|uniref:Zinc finger protein 704-like n=1 Tax=Microcaecilia unicolor TaxID=1415580 RepID=A0A6P7Z1H6_9AMPH|nr:zinc finger protein 704-like [Microcaecilia unicolor]
MSWWLHDSNLQQRMPLASPQWVMVVTAYRGGGSLSPLLFIGVLDSGRSSMAHQLAGTVGSVECLADFLGLLEGQAVHILLEASGLLEWVDSHILCLLVAHIVGQCNVQVDFLDHHFLNSEEWELASEAFLQICQKWGMPEIDLMVTRVNAKVDKLFRRRREPGSSGMDALLQPWVESALHLSSLALDRSIIRGVLVSDTLTSLVLRKLSEKAGIDEVMAAAVLTSLSTSPVVLSQTASTCAADPCGENWKEVAVMSSSYSSSTNSGDWNWDLPSDHSVPSTPSPPLSIEAGKNFLLTAQSDEGIEDTEATQFLFGDHIPRKRKNSVKVMFKCLWKNCGKVLSTSTGIQKHIRALHLGRKADLDQSDGEEDFYYTEIDINVDSLTDGLSSLAPMSPTASAPPAFPLPETQGTQLPAETPEVPLVSSLSHSAPTTLCHVHSDHAYQALSPISICAGSSFSFSWQPPPLLFKSSPGCLAQIRTVGTGEKLPQIAHSAVIKTSTMISVPKPALGTRKPRGEAKKCRKVYGMENRDMWCTACRWKKACQRFTD